MLPRLYPILDVETLAARGWAPLDVAEVWFDAGFRVIQLRSKSMRSGPMQELADALVARAHAGGAKVIINDRADIAVLSGADGVHVGQDDLSPPDARVVVGAHAIVGLSTHDESQVEAALAQPISYLAIGPVFGTTTKDTGYEARGLAMVTSTAAATREAGVPLVAIGGITRDNARMVLDAGADSLAVISGLLPTSITDLAATAREWRSVIN